jgi:hypothetical protein
LGPIPNPQSPIPKKKISSTFDEILNIYLIKKFKLFKILNIKNCYFLINT